MIRLSIIIVTIFIGSIAFAQKKINFTLEKKYTIEGVIFIADYPVNFQLKNSIDRFTPSLNDIKTCERYLLMNLSDVKYVDLQGFYSPRGLLKKLKTYKRQYVGFIDANKDSIILVQLLNFKHQKEAMKNFDEWDSQFLLGFDGYYEANIKRLQVNISKKNVSLY